MDIGYFVETNDVLANKLGISNSAELEKVEYAITNEKIAIVLATKSPSLFDFGQLLHLHKILFEDIYDFAGKVRTVNISKPDSPVPFCYADFIPSESARIFSELAEDNYLSGLNHDIFTTKLAYYASELNALHPFREGNGRTIRLFLMLLAKNSHYLLDYSQVTREEILSADRTAFSGDLLPLEQLYHNITFRI